MFSYSVSYGELELFILVLMRVASFVFVAPFFSMTNTPRHIRVLMSIFLSIVIFGIIPKDAFSYSGLLPYTVVVLKEVLTGLIIGFGANMCMLIVNFAGHIADMEMGLSMVSMMDPATRQSATISGVYYNYSILLMLLISGMHRYLIRALVETYTLIPINGQLFHMNKLMSGMLEFMADYVLIGFRICLPIFATMIILNAVLGILAKVSPQLNMFAVGMQIKVLTGIGILFLSAMLLPDAADMIYVEMKHMIVTMVQAIS